MWLLRRGSVSGLFSLQIRCFTPPPPPPKNEKKCIAFIGGGVMGEAMVAGLLRNKEYKASEICVADPSVDRLDYLKEKYNVAITNDNVKAAQKANVVVLSIKPQHIPKVLPALRGTLHSDDVLISILAGTSNETLCSGIAHAACVRAMPNTPGQVGQGITVWTGTKTLTKPQKIMAETVLGAMGDCVYVDDEAHLDIATALSGSGPGYVFLMMEAMTDAGVHLGLNRKVAQKLVYQTVAGSVQYAKKNGGHVAVLRNQVTSPGGTTAEAIYYLEKGGFRNVLSRAIFAAHHRSVELGKGSGNTQRSPHFQ